MSRDRPGDFGRESGEGSKFNTGGPCGTLGTARSGGSQLRDRGGIDARLLRVCGLFSAATSVACCFLREKSRRCDLLPFRGFAGGDSGGGGAGADGEAGGDTKSARAGVLLGAGLKSESRSFIRECGESSNSWLHTTWRRTTW